MTLDLAGERDRLLEALVREAQRLPGALGLWLQGSLASGEADALSDIDAHLGLEDSAAEGFWRDREGFLARLGQVLVWTDLTAPGVAGAHALYASGVRLDLIVETGPQLAAAARPPLRILVDKGALHDSLRPGWTPPTATIARNLQHIVRMTRQGGTWPLRAILRGDWSTFAMMELDLVNAQLAQLIAVRADPALFFQHPYGLPRRLAPDGRRALEALTDRVLEAVTQRRFGLALAAHLDIYDALVREGRGACEALGSPYPIEPDADASLRRLLEARWPRDIPAQGGAT